MLEHVFGSRTRVKLLNLFLRHPTEPMFVREITRLIGTQINAVRRELMNLVKFGLVVEVEVAEPEEPGVKKRAGLKRKYYITNAKFALLNEIKALFLKAQVMLESTLDQQIVKMGDIRYLAFLGIFLGAGPAPVDVFVVGDISKTALQKLLADTEKELGCEVNFSLMTLEEFRYRKDITDRFLYSILEAPKNVVIDRLNERD